MIDNPVLRIIAKIIIPMILLFALYVQLVWETHSRKSCRHPSHHREVSLSEVVRVKSS